MWFPSVLVAGLSLLSLNTWAGNGEAVDALCKRISAKLASVSYQECAGIGYSAPRYYSRNQQPILEAHFAADPKVENPVRILFIGGIHGDEYSSVSVTFKWLNTLNKHHSGAFDWHFLPLANPDGLLKPRSTRVNANDVDLNRNFTPSAEGLSPLEHWRQNAGQRPRYYPGEQPLSEPESQMIHRLIEEYAPSVIVSVHAPHGILDFDGHQQPPQNLGPLQLRQLGTYPGSLGNYGWFVRGVPVMTIELPYAGIMPSAGDVSRMWVDLVRWIRYESKAGAETVAKN